MPMDWWTEIEAEARAVIWRRAVIIIIRRRRIAWIHIHWRTRGRVCWRRLVHVEIDALRNMVLRAKPPAGPEHSHLGKLVGRQRQCPDYIIIGAKVVERAVSVAEDFQVDRGIADKVAVCFDPGARIGSLHQHVMRDRAVGSALSTR